MEEEGKIVRRVHKWGSYEQTVAVQAVIEAAETFGDFNQVVEWAKAPGRRGVSAVGLARLESARDALGRRVLKLVNAMPPECFSRKAAKRPAATTKGRR